MTDVTPGPGDRLGPYEIRDRLGAGGMGTVLRGWQPDLGREVAIKVIRGTTDDSGARRFRREMGVHVGLSHPNLVKVYDAGRSGEVDYLVMELLEGWTLSEELRRRGKLPIERAASIARDLADALAYLHTTGIIHRDLKPPNVMLDPTGSVKLMDLGLAHAEGHTLLTGDDEMLGTLRYLPPEATEGPVRDPRADVHSLGVVLFESLTGKLPYRGSTFQIFLAALVMERPPLLREVIPGVPPALESLVDRMLQKDPANRPHASDVVKDLDEVLTLLAGRGSISLPVALPPEPRAVDDDAPTAPLEQPGRKKRSRPQQDTVAVRHGGVKAVVGGVLVVLVAALIAFFMLRSSPMPRLELTVRGRSVTVITRPALPGWRLCVYDGERVMGTAPGEPEAGSTSFHVRGLAPGHAYRARLLATAGDSAPIDLMLETPIELDLIGMDPEGDAVWLRTAPETRVRWAGAGEWVRVGAEPVRLAGYARELEVQGGSGAPATLALTAPVALENAPLDLGLIVGPDPAHEVMLEGPRSRPLSEWFRENRLGWIVLPPAGDGRPRLAQRSEVRPFAPRQIFGMYVAATSKREAWMQDVRAVSTSADPIHLAIDAEWMYAAGLQTQGDEELGGNFAAWRSFVDHELPGGSFLVPAPLGLAFLELRSGAPSKWFKSLGRLEAISLESLSDNASWETDRVKLQRGAEAIGLRPDVRFAWIISAIRTDLFAPGGTPSGNDSLGLARCFTFARAAYPGITVIADLREIAGSPPDRRLVPTGERLLAVARALRGTRFRRHLTTKSEGARLESKDPVVALAFASPARAVQVLLTDTRPVPARFTPARPGLLRTPGPPELPWSTRLVTEVTPLDLQLSSSPVIYEELVSLDATPRTTIPIDVITRR